MALGWGAMGLPNFRPVELCNGVTIYDYHEFEQIKAACRDVVRCNVVPVDCDICVLWRCRLCDYNWYPPDDQSECQDCANFHEDCPITGSRGLRCTVADFTKLLLELL